MILSRADKDKLIALYSASLDAEWPDGPLPADVRSERNIATLIPRAQKAAREHLQGVNAWLFTHAKGHVAKIIDGTRTYAEQDKLYAQGRTAPGKIVTNARGGQSWHNFGVAWDIGVFAPLGAYLGDSPYYDKAGEIGRIQGLEWGGDWRTFQDKPHFQLAGFTLAKLQDMKQNGIAIT